MDIKTKRSLQNCHTLEEARDALREDEVKYSGWDLRIQIFTRASTVKLQRSVL